MAATAHVLDTPRATARTHARRRRIAYLASATIAIARGHWYRVKYRLLGVGFRAGRNLRVYGRLDVRGPGQVSLGDDTLVFDRCQLITHSDEARLRIGSGLQMRSTHFDCAREIVVGDDCQLAMSYIADTDSHSTRADRHTPGAPVRTAPVRIDDNVWVAQFAGILPGAVIGRNSVVSCGSVCARAYPPNAILVGNPARVAGTVQAADMPPSEVV